MRIKYKIGILGAFFVLVLVAGLLVLSRLSLNHATIDEFIVEESEYGGRLSKIMKKYKDLPMKDVSLSELEGEISEIEGIKRVIARKQYPNKIRIKIVERKPVAIVIVNGKIIWVDQEGKQTEKVNIIEFTPVLSNVRIQSENGKISIDSSFNDYLKFCKAITETKYAKMILTRVSCKNKMHALSKGSSTKFIFSRQLDYKKQLKHFEVFWKRVITKKGLEAFSYVDFRFKGKVFAKPKNL